MKKLLLPLLLLLALPINAMAGGRCEDIRVKMTAEILNVDGELLVKTLESEYSFGEHIVILSDDTVYLNSVGEKISREELRVGDHVEIFYNGQVMMSYPAKIVGIKIVRL